MVPNRKTAIVFAQIEDWYDKSWHKLAQVQHPSPAEALVFVDEHENSIQQGAFGINAPNKYVPYPPITLWGWISFPAVRHGGGGTVSFADGHAVLWKWKEANTLKLGRSSPWLVLKNGAGVNDRDLGCFFGGVPATVPIVPVAARNQ